MAWGGTECIWVLQIGPAAGCARPIAVHSFMEPNGGEAWQPPKKGEKRQRPSNQPVEAAPAMKAGCEPEERQPEVKVSWGPSLPPPPSAGGRWHLCHHPRRGDTCGAGAPLGAVSYRV